MAKKYTEIIRQIKVDTCLVKGGHIWTKTAILFESGKRYATSIIGVDQRVEKFDAGDEVLVTAAGDNVLQVQKA